MYRLVVFGVLVEFREENEDDLAAGRKDLGVPRLLFSPPQSR